MIVSMLIIYIVLITSQVNGESFNYFKNEKIIISSYKIDNLNLFDGNINKKSLNIVFRFFFFIINMIYKVKQLKIKYIFYV